MATAALAGTVLADTGNTATYTTASQSVTAGDLIVVFGSPGAETTDDWVLSDSQGGTYTRLQRAARSGSGSFMSAWVRNTAVTTSAAFTVTMSHASGNATGGLIAVYKVSGSGGRYGASAARQSAKHENFTTPTVPAPAFGIAALTGNVVLGAVNSLANPPTVSPTTSGGTFTEDADTGYNTPATGIEVQHINSGFTGTTVTWGSAVGSGSCAIVVEVDTSAPAASLSPAPAILSRTPRRVARITN